jgi:hypothetical protein
MLKVITSLPDTGRTHHRRFVWYLFSLLTTRDKTSSWQTLTEAFQINSQSCVCASQSYSRLDVWRVQKSFQATRHVAKRRAVRQRLVHVHSYVSSTVCFRPAGSVHNVMQQNHFSDTVSGSAAPQILRSLWKSKVHYCFHRSPPLVLVLSKTTLVHNLTFYFFFFTLVTV